MESGANILTGSDPKKILKAVKNFKGVKKYPYIFGDGRTSDKIVEILKSYKFVGAVQ